MLHTLVGHWYMKSEKYMKNMIAITFFHIFLNHIFSCISHFSCRRVHKIYGTYVLLGLGIKLYIQRVLLLRI